MQSPLSLSLHFFNPMLGPSYRLKVARFYLIHYHFLCQIYIVYASGNYVTNCVWAWTRDRYETPWWKYLDLMKSTLSNHEVRWNFDCDLTWNKTKFLLLVWIKLERLADDLNSSLWWLKVAETYLKMIKFTHKLSDMKLVGDEFSLKRILKCQFFVSQHNR